MLLKTTHFTDLTYTGLISESVMELRMAPRQEQDQHRLSFTLAVGPASPAFSYFDWLGNTVHWFTVNPFHRQIRIVATSVVETDRPRPEPQRFKDTWPVPPDAYDYAVYDYLQFGGPILDSPALRELAGILSPQQGHSLGELALAMMHLIADRFSYQKGITTSASTLVEVLEKRSGVCQDFAHLMVAIARLLKIPARYVSGLVHPDGERFRGFTQTHAWCELLFPSAGWVGFDPTNNCLVGPNFVKVAIGRDYHDVPPNKGQYTGNAKESIEVTVNTEPLKEIPPELAAERVQSLPVPIFPGGPSVHGDFVNQQQEQQQQQQMMNYQRQLCRSAIRLR
jgi:transglutaminase-like putative cysteine protease